MAVARSAEGLQRMQLHAQLAIVFRHVADIGARKYRRLRKQLAELPSPDEERDSEDASVETDYILATSIGSFEHILDRTLRAHLERAGWEQIGPVENCVFVRDFEQTSARIRYRVPSPAKTAAELVGRAMCGSYDAPQVRCEGKEAEDAWTNALREVGASFLAGRNALEDAARELAPSLLDCLKVGLDGHQLAQAIEAACYRHEDEVRAFVDQYRA